MDKKQNILCCRFFFLFLPGKKKSLKKFEKNTKQSNKQFQDSLFKFIHNISHNTLPKEPRQ